MTEKPKKARLLAMHHTLGQLQLVLLIILLFFIGGLLAVRRNGGSAGLPPLAIALAVALGLAGCIITDIAVAHRLNKTVAGWLHLNRAALLLAAITVVLRLPQLGAIPRNDSSVYYGALYRACQGFTFTLSYWFDAFRLAGHPSYGYASLAAIPEFFFPGHFSNIWLLQTLLSVFAVCCIYDLLHRQKPFGEKKAFWAALLCSCCAMFLGLGSYFQMDFGSAVACIFTLWAMLRGKNILLIFFAGVLVLSKEFGIGLFVGLFLGIFFYYFFVIAKGNPWKRFLTVMRQPSLRIVFIMCGVGGLAVLYYLFGTSSAWTSVLTAKKGEQELGYIGFNATYIKNKLVQLVCTNFVWLQLAVQAACLIWRKLAKKDPLSVGTKMMLSGIVGAAILYFALSCAMVTYTIARYNLPMELLITIVTAILLLSAVDGVAVRLLPAVLALLLSVQGYLTVDPIMTVVYPKVYTGSLPLALQSNDGRGLFIGDYVVYNYQYTYQDRCVANILSEVYDENTNFLASPWDNGLYIGGAGQFLWDMQAKHWTIAPSEAAAPIETLSPGLENGDCATMLAEGKFKSKAVFVFVPNHEDTEERITRFEATLPAYFVNLVRHECKDGLYGTMIYYTADIQL